MFTQPVHVHYLDGTTKDVVLDQWSVSQFAIFAAKQGWRMDMSDPGPLGVTMLRVQAWAQMHRDSNGTKPGFDVWDRTVAEVEPVEESEQADPTQSTTSGG